MKFWKNLKSSAFNGFATLDRNGNNNNNSKRNSNGEQQRISTTPAVQRRAARKYNFNSLQDEDPIYEDFAPSPSPSLSGCSDLSGPNSFGTTFVELIKRQGTKLGVVVSGSMVDHGVEPRISELVQGSWAQRSDVLCVGDAVVSINGASTAAMTQRDLSRTLEQSDRVQLEVRYPLPPPAPSSRSRLVRTKVIQVTLRKENGSFGMVIRGGSHEIARRKRPFTVVHVSSTGPAFKDGTIRVNDRLRAINGHRLQNMKLPELQSLLYQQDRDTVFTVEYDVAVHERLDHGPVLVEISRDASDVIGFGLNKCGDSGHVFIESIRQASLADRCGAMHVGDILLSVNGRNVSGLSTDETTDLIRGDNEVPHVVQLEILPGMFSRASSFRSSMPSPCFSSLRTQRLRSGGRPCQRYQSMTEIDRPNSYSSYGSSNSSSRPLIPLIPTSNLKERRKFVTFTVELQRDGGPLGLTLAAEDDADLPGPIFISALMHDGLAERTMTIQVNDQLVEVNGQEIKDKCLNEVIPLLQECSSEVIKLKLARLISIPERDFSSSATLQRRSRDQDVYSSSNFRKPPLPSPSPSRTPVHMHRTSSRRDSASSTTTRDTNHSPTPTNSNNTVSLLPISAISRSSPHRNSGGMLARPIPMEVHKVTLFKDRVYEDFGFSVSDGLYEKGIFLNRIRKGGPADACGLLKPLDRILQINDTRTNDFDCCLAVPLIAAAGDKIELLVARTTKVFALRNSGDLDDRALEVMESDYCFDDRTLTRRSQERRKGLANEGGSLKRVSRTSSADGRLGSVTNHVVPWSHSFNGDDGDNAVL